LLDISADVHDAQKVTNKQIEDLALLAGFAKLSSNTNTAIFCRGSNKLRVLTNSSWGFYNEGSQGKAPDICGSDHASLAKFLKRQIEKN